MVIRVRTRLAALPDLERVAHARIRAVEMRAMDLLLTEISEAFQQFNDGEARARAGNATLAERATALRTAQRALAKRED